MYTVQYRGTSSQCTVHCTRVQYRGTGSQCTEVALVLAPVPLLGRVVVVSPELVVAAGRRGGLPRCGPGGGGNGGGGGRCAHPCLLDADAETVDLPGGRGQVALELQLSLPQSANMKAWVSTGQVRSGKNGGKTY